MPDPVVTVVESDHLCVRDVFPGEVVVVRGGPVFRVCEPDRDPGPEPAIDLSSIGDVPADPGSCVKQLCEVLDRFWHDGGEHGRHIDTIVHSGLPPHWHSSDGDITWFSCISELGDVEDIEQALAEIGLRHASSRPD